MKLSSFLSCTYSSKKSLSFSYKEARGTLAESGNMAFVDLLETQHEPKFSPYGKDPFIRPSFPGFFSPNYPPIRPPFPHHCINCLMQCNPSVTFNGLCPNCSQHTSSPSITTISSNGSSPPEPENSSDSFIMSNMLHVVDDVLREDTALDSRLQVCSECGLGSMASSPCLECQNYFCVSCFVTHYRDHHFVDSPKPPLSPPTETELDVKEAEFCDKHPKERLCYFCEPCTSLLCYSCISRGHQHHPHTTIKKEYRRIQQSIESLPANMSSRLHSLCLAADSAEKMHQSIVIKKEEAITNVHKIFKSLREAIAKCEKEIVAQIVTITDLRLDSLSKEREKNEEVVDELKNLQESMIMAKEQGKKASTVLLLHKITKQLENLNTDCEIPVEDDTYILKSNTGSVQDALKSICVLTTAPYPPLCTAMGEGLYHPRINKLTTVVVCTKDRSGDPCVEGGAQLCVSLRINGGSLLPVDVRDNKDGSYSVNFRPRVKGEHQLSISIRGHHIQGSPFTLLVDGGREYGHFGVVTQVFGSEGGQPGQFCRPWGISCDQKGHVIVGDRSNHRIQVFDANGFLKYHFGSEGNRPGQFNRPAGVATTREGHVVVADKDNHRIQVLKIDGTFKFMFGSKGGNDGQMIYPYDVAVNQLDGRIAVTDTGNHRLLIFSHDGILLGKFGYKGYLCGHFDSPRGIAFNEEGHIIVSDFNVHHILVIHPDGTTARILGSQGIGNGQFMRPQGIAVDHMGNFVIADTRNNRIVVMHSSGYFIAKFGTTGAGQGQFDRPTSVCVMPDGRIAVVDFGNSRVQIF